MVTVSTAEIPKPSQLADVGRPALFAISLNVTVGIAYIGYASSLPHDDWLREELVNFANHIGLSLGWTVILELLRWVGFFDPGKPSKWMRFLFVGAYSISALYAAFAFMSVAAQMKGAQTYMTSDHYKLVVAYAECKKNKKEMTEKAQSKINAARYANAQCVEEFEKKPKSYFGQTETVADYCKSKKATLDKAEKDHRQVTAEPCVKPPAYK